MLNSKGFTLIELMIVVVIIGILAAIAIPNFIAMQDRAREASVKANMHSFQLAIEDFAVKNTGTYPVAGDNAAVLANLPSGNWPKNVGRGSGGAAHLRCEPLCHDGLHDQGIRQDGASDADADQRLITDRVHWRQIAAQRDCRLLLWAFAAGELASVLLPLGTRALPHRGGCLGGGAGVMSVASPAGGAAGLARAGSAIARQ